MPLLLSTRAVTRPPVPVLTSAEGRDLGIRLPDRAFVRIRHGVYADAEAVRSLAPWERYALRVHAFVRAHPDAILCLESAAVVHGLPLFGEARVVFFGGVESCNDAFLADALSYAAAPADGSARTQSSCRQHVLRGGSWRDQPEDLEVTTRNFYDNDVRYPGNGLRVARDLD